MLAIKRTCTSARSCRARGSRAKKRPVGSSSRPYIAGEAGSPGELPGGCPQALSELTRATSGEFWKDLYQNERLDVQELGEILLP